MYLFLELAILLPIAYPNNKVYAMALLPHINLNTVILWTNILNAPKKG